MKQTYRNRRSARLRRYHFREGAKWRRPVLLPSFLAGLFVFVAGAGLSHADLRDFIGRQTNNNVVTATTQEPEVSALKQSIIRANELDKQDKSLAETIKIQLDNYPKSQKWSVYVNDLSSGLSASVNADEIYSAGSLHKLFLLAPLESKVPASEWDYNWVGGYNINYCVQMSLGAADDICSLQLGGYANWDYADKYNHEVGFINTDLGAGTEAKTNVRDVGQLLTQLKRSQALSDAGRRQVFDALYFQDYISGLPTVCDDCAVANKPARQGDFVHDAGIITRGQKSYVITIMSKGGSLKQIGQIARAVDAQLNP